MEAKTSATYRLTVDAPAPRLDRFLVEHFPTLSRSFLQKLIEGGLVLINGGASKGSQRLKAGDSILLAVPPPEKVAIEREPIPLAVVYEDQDLLVVDKPPDLPVHPGPGHSTHTLVNALLAYCADLKGIGGELRPGIVHRLDKDTSGLIVVAKSDQSLNYLSKQLKERAMKKKYIALVKGHLQPGVGRVDAPIARDPRNRKRMAIVAGGRQAVTNYGATEYLGDYTLVELSPETGRTHQLRVHMAYLGHPIAGDPIYGRGPAIVRRQFLHASSLAFRLPSSGVYSEFHSELPLDLAEVIRRLKAGALAPTFP